MPLKANVLLPQGQRLASRHAQLEFDEVDARHHFRNRVFNLETRIDLEEVHIRLGERVPARVLPLHKELKRAGIYVPNRPREGERVAGKARSKAVIDYGTRGLFDELLVPALDRTVPLSKVDNVAMRIADDLHLNVMGVGHEPFE